MNVLVLEDSLAVRTRLVEFLGDLPDVHITGQAGSVAEALHDIEVLPLDVVIVDLQLPDGTGLDVVRAAKAHRPSIGVVIFTSYAGDEFRRAGRAAGADWVLDKGADTDRLPGVLDTFRPRRGAPRTPTP